ncbi:MAG: RNA polymerase sigma factor [Kiritimatiellae bacterium]|nr:RNA polymerase sigma factor [Kiritimatiellia bacterium]
MIDIVDEIRNDPAKGARRLEAEYRAGLFTLARRLCQDDGDAAELVNRTFAEVIANIDDYAEKSAFFAWMSKILVNINGKDRRRRENKSVVYPGEVPEVADEDAEEYIYRTVDASLVRDAVESLPQDIRKTVILHYFMEMPIREVARILSVPSGTVSWRLHYARMLLAAKFGAVAKKPGGKALLLAMALFGLGAFGAGVWNLAMGGDSGNSPGSRDTLPQPAATESARNLSAQILNYEGENMNVRNLVSAGVAGTMLAAAANAATLPSAPDVLSDGLQAKIALWLDASKNLVTDGSGNVVAWCDAREEAIADAAAYEARVAAGSWTYPRAVVWTSGAAPSGAVPVGASAPASFGGRPYVDFGEYNDNRWMLFVDAAGARRRVTLTGYAGVLGFGSTAGFVVGDVNDPDILAQSATGVGDNGTQYFHKGYGGNGNDAIFADSNGIGRRGETRKNGHVVKSTQNDNENRHVRNGWEVFVQNGPNQEMFVSTLFNNGNYKASVNASYTDRQGGGKIAEIVILSEMLTQGEVAELEAYLRAKWMGGAGNATATVANAAGDTLSVQADGPAFVGDIAGAGALEKTGTSSLTIDRNGRLAAGPLTLRDGGVVTWAKRAHHAPLVAIGGKTVSAAASSLSATAAGDAGTFTLNENTDGRRVALAGAESGVKKIAASKAAVCLRPQALPAADVATVEDPDFLAIGNLIQNGSFEAGSLASWTGSDLRFDNYSGAAMSVATRGTQGEKDWTGNVNVGTIPAGDRFGYIQVKNSVNCTNGYYQTVTAPRAGLYRFSAWIRARKRSYADSTVRFCLAVDDTVVLSRRTGRRGVWNASTRTFTTSETECTFQKISVDIALDTQPHKIQILAANTDNETDAANKRFDRALLIDDIRLEPVAEGDFVQVKDPGFDSCTTWAEAEINSSNGGSLSTAATPFWTVSGGALSRYPSTWFCNPLYDGLGEDQQAALQNGATASQTVAFPRAGRVRVSARYAKRSDRLDTGASRVGGQTFSISLGGSVIGSAVVTSADFSTLVAEGDVEAGAQTLVLSGGSVSGSDVTTIMDDIRIEYVGGTDRAVEDTAFADGSSTWTRNGAVAESDAFGLRELVFTGTASATASFTVPADGYYLLTFQTRGRPLSESGQTGIYHSFNYYTHNLDVRVDGGSLANVFNAHAGRFPVEMRLPYLTAGTHTLLFAGSSDSSVATTAQSRISEVTVTPLATGAMADWSGVEFDLANDATINADLPGKVRLGKLRVDGAAQYGEFTAANCDFVTGAGTVEVVPDAFIMVVR